MRDGDHTSLRPPPSFVILQSLHLFPLSFHPGEGGALLSGEPSPVVFSATALAIAKGTAAENWYPVFLSLLSLPFIGGTQLYWASE